MWILRDDCMYFQVLLQVPQKKGSYVTMVGQGQPNHMGASSSSDDEMKYKMCDYVTMVL